MKIWTSAQRAVEKRVNLYISQMERTEEKEQLEHAAQCGSILKENAAEISIYLAYKQGKKSVEIPSDSPASESSAPADKT